MILLFCKCRFRRHVFARGPSVCLSVCMSVTLVHPAKAVGRTEMPFGRDTRVAPSDTALDGGPVLHMKRGDLWVGTLNQPPRTVNIFTSVR